jgi:hypothetical protein
MSCGARADEGDDDEPLLAELLRALPSRRLRLALIRRLIALGLAVNAQDAADARSPRGTGRGPRASQAADRQA